MRVSQARGRISHFMSVSLAIGLLGGAPGALAHDSRSGGSDELAYANVLGGIATAQTANPGKIHAVGTVGVSTADFFRGAFDNIPDDLGIYTFPLELSAIIELRRGRDGPVRDLALTVGSANNVASEGPPTLVREEGTELDVWYESDNYAALTARLGRDWLAGLTYTFYTNPALGLVDQEVALAARYAGPGLLGGLGPQLKLAVPTDEDGAFTQLRFAPGRTVLQGSAYPVTLELGVELGVGFADYYGTGTGTTGYAGVIPAASVPLKALADGDGDGDGGGWTLSAALGVLVRADELQEVGGEFTDEDAVVVDGIVTLSFAY